TSNAEGGADNAGAAGIDGASGSQDTGGSAGTSGTAGSAGMSTVPAVCAQDATWKTPSNVDGVDDGTTSLSVTLSELSMSLGQGDQFFVGDRVRASHPFAVNAVPVPDGFTASEGLTLSDNGLALIVVAADPRGFGVMKRQSVSGAFGAPD